MMITFILVEFLNQKTIVKLAIMDFSIMIDTMRLFVYIAMYGLPRIAEKMIVISVIPDLILR